MAPITDPLTCIESFLQENQQFEEIVLNAESKPIGKLHELDLLEHEIWLLQCPKGMDITELQNQKLKIPGRTNISTSEAVSMEFHEGKEQHAFAYCSRKERYDLRLLPVRGTIVLRDRLKAAATVTSESAEKYCPPNKRVPMPASIRVRHPLLGVQYEDKLELDNSIVKRLQKADAISAGILKERLNQKNKPKLGIGFGKTSDKQHMVSPIEIESADDDESIEFISEEKLKKKKYKRKYSESSKTHVSGNTASKKKKSKINYEVSKDLEWIQNI